MKNAKRLEMNITMSPQQKLDNLCEKIVSKFSLNGKNHLKHNLEIVKKEKLIDDILNLPLNQHFIDKEVKHIANTIFKKRKRNIKIGRKIRGKISFPLM